VEAHVIMVEPDIIVDKWGCLELQVVFNREECDQTFESCSIKVMDTLEREAVQIDRDNGGDGSHVQEGFGWRPKE